MSVFRASDLRFSYSDSLSDVLRIGRLSIDEGQFVSLLGASGSGKSTLLRLLAGLRSPSAGTLQSAAGPAGMVFQSPNLIPWRTAWQNIRLPSELGIARDAELSHRISELLRLVGFRDEDVHKRPAELSGGMQMRVALARALVLQPSVLLLDEPFAALDDVLRMQLEEDVRDIHDQQSLTTVLVTHNIHEAVFMSDRVLVLGDLPSRIVADIPIEADQRTAEFRSSSNFHQYVIDVTSELYSAASGMDA